MDRDSKGRFTRRTESDEERDGRAGVRESTMVGSPERAMMPSPIRRFIGRLRGTTDTDRTNS